MIARVSISALLLLSALAIGTAPLILPEGYSWVSHSISESGAQGLEGAWLARLGLLSFGFGVLWLPRVAGSGWGPSGTFLIRCFGVLMVAAAAFSHSPWTPGAPEDPVEDFLHSMAATGMGFAFTVGVVVVMLHRVDPGRLQRALDLSAIVAAVAIPISMTIWTGYAGLLQRSMFGIAYLWYLTEALHPFEPWPR